MEAYTGFARVYDLFMDNVPYDRWCADTVRLLSEYGIKDGIVADLGCGTGSITERMAAKGFDMIGIDSSEDMLEIALDKKINSGHNILYLCQDMRSFELYGTCAAIISRCDAINYILNMKDLVAVFRLVNNYLDPGGVFIFDCNTVHKYETVLANNTISETRDAGSFIWENFYDSVTGINEYDLTLYVRDPQMKDQERFMRFEETHIQKAFTDTEIRRAAESAGLQWLRILDAKTLKEPVSDTERFLIILGEHGKNR